VTQALGGYFHFRQPTIPEKGREEFTCLWGGYLEPYRFLIGEVGILGREYGARRSISERELRK